jgi:hypothetical protein
MVELLCPLFNQPAGAPQHRALVVVDYVRKGHATSTSSTNTTVAPTKHQHW